MSSERAREREVLKYYQTWLESSVGFNSPTQTAPSDLFHNDGTGLRSSRDKALIAFAQLGCLRLNVKRALVTLIARTRQYILAEATRTLSLVSDSQHASEDGLWFGNSSLPRSQGISEHALNPASYTASGPNGESYTAAAFVVDDIAQDERFMHREYAGSGVSFYAGVPITTISGFAVGVYTVTDDQPRPGLSAEELQFMQDMASIVGGHLDRIKNESARYRGERMVLGLGSFIEGKSTTHGEAGYFDQPIYSERIEHLSRQTPNAGDVHQQFKGMTITNADPTALRKGWTSEVIENVVTSSHSAIGGSTNVTNSPLKNLATLLEHQKGREEVLHDPTVRPGSSNSETSEDRLSPIQSKDLRHIFWRAANIMRECTAADGVVFYNAMHTQDAKGRRRADSSYLNVTPVQQSEVSTPGSSDEPQHGDNRHFGRSRSNSSEARKKASGPASQTRDAKSKKCQKLGFSLNVSADSAVSKMSTGSLDVSEHTLRRFLRRYPRGKVFYYTEEGDVSTSEGERQQVKSRVKDLIKDQQAVHPMDQRKALGRVFAEELLKVVPGARSVIFLPLWDFQEQTWAAGTFVWSRRAGQLLHAQDDLSYLKAFGNTIMSEVARLDAVTADKAKTSFIANISHELRSPLHGILGSIEFLQDTAVDAFQSSLLVSIETCSKTLLDTLNNLLVYAKINHLSRRLSGKSAQSTSGGSSSDLRNSSAKNLETDFDLAIIVEEVVEAVCAGQTFQPTGILHDVDDTRIPCVEATKSAVDTYGVKRNSQRTPSKRSGQVRLTLDIEYLSDWRVHSQPGAIRRLAMNLLGNALKYTEKGTIRVSLKLRQRPSNESSSLDVCLSVTDTGKGMSANFVKNHAFTPFIQEDSFASGTGLGLSIVQQIVNSLGGKIDLQSKQGTGTGVQIWLTLPRARSAQGFGLSVGLFPSIVKETQGLKICMLDPNFAGHDSTMHAVERGEPDPVDSSIRNIAREWFKMDVSVSSQTNEVSADIFIYAEPPPIEHLLDRHGKPPTGVEVPFIVVATDALETASLRANGINQLVEMGRISEVISQPCGPQKLARVIHWCLRKLDELREERKDTSTSALVKTQLYNTVNKWRLSAEIKNVRPLIDEPARTSGARNGERFLEEKPQKPEVPPDRILRILSTTPTDRERNSRPHLRPEDKTYSASSANTIDFEVPETAHEKPRILLVDDNYINLKLLVTFVRKAHYPYECATNGLQAVEAYKRASGAQDRAFRYVLMDISMPVMDGMAATREIRDFEKKNRIEPRSVIIALTGLASGMAQVDALHSGINYFQVKPVKFKDLLKILEY